MKKFISTYNGVDKYYRIAIFNAGIKLYLLILFKEQITKRS